MSTIGTQTTRKVQVRFCAVCSSPIDEKRMCKVRCAHDLAMVRPRGTVITRIYERQDTLIEERIDA